MLLKLIITTIIVMHSTVMITMPALLSLDVFRKEEECRNADEISGGAESDSGTESIWTNLKSEDKLF